MKEWKLSNREISEFCRSLSLLLRAGIHPGDGLFLMAEEESGRMKVKLEEMGRNLDQGMTISQTIEEQKLFPAYVTGMVKVGEQSGRLEEALLALAGYYEEREQMNRQIRQALTYPSILMAMLLAVIGVLLVKVLPIFEEVYASLGGHLTGIAGALLACGQILEAAMPLLCLILAVLAVGVILYAANDAVHETINGWWQRHYGDTGVSRMVNDAHFAQALAMGLKSGLPIEDAVEQAGEILKDVPEAAARCRFCADGLMRGESLSHVLKESRILPPSACRMMDLGIRSGSGDTVMEEIAEKLSADAGYALEQKAARVEPIMVLTASVLVGCILLSVMLPLMHIMTMIG